MNMNEKRIQYKDFSVWQNVHDIKEQEEYWINEFSKEIPRLDIKTDFLRPQMQSFKGADYVIKVDEQISIAVKDLARKYEATEFMVTLAVFMSMLQKYSQKEEIVVGTAVSGRTHADTKGMLGMFVNTLAIKCGVTPTQTFEDLLDHVKQKCLQAFDHQEYQFEDLVEAVEKKRDLSRNPIFDVMFVLKEKKNTVSAKGLLGGKSALIKRNVSKFDFTLMVTCVEDGYEIDIEYCTDLFKEETIQYMAQHYIKLLKMAVQNPEMKLQDLHMMDAKEEEKVLYEFNQTFCEFPREKTIVDIFEEQVEKSPDNIALKFEDQTMTYAELNEKSNQLAKRLREVGIVPEDRVALLAERSMEMIIGIFGIIKAGGCYVPINPHYPTQRISYILNDSNPKAVVTYKATVQEGMEKISLDLEDMNSYADIKDNLPHVNQPGDIVYCIYTSGTTGNPKGVLVEHHNLVNMWVTYSRTFALTQKDTSLQFASVAFDQAVGDIFSTLCNGAALCIVPSYITYDMEQLQQYININNVTCMSLTPKVIEGLNVEQLPTLRLLESGGEAGNPEKLKQWAKNVKVINTYGPTESTVNATSFQVKSNSEMISIGSPIINTRVYLLYGMELCGIGIPGELCIAGEGLARGYLNREELTAEKFIQNPFHEGRLYRTGDLARWLPDGNLEYLGRIDEQVKIRGYRIELGEIESVLRKQDKIADVTVILCEVGGEKCLCAYLVADQGETLDIPEIKESLRKELTEYMIPSFIMQVDELPLTLNGKIDKSALPKPDNVDGYNYVPPKLKTEQEIVEVFEEILGVSPIGIEDSFFELGGHSLRATTAINLIEKRTGIRLPIKEIFSSPTPSMLAKKIDELGNGQYCAIPKAEEKEWYFASSAQKRLFILEQIEGSSTTYNMPDALETSSALDINKVEDAVNRLINRHESLRTSFALQDGEVVQIISEEAIYKVDYEEQDDICEEEIKEFIRPFDLGKAPLFRFKVIKCKKDNKYILLFDMHHIISDHKTINILTEDFVRLYNEEELQPLKIQYKDYSDWMRTRDLGKQREYWKKIFEDQVPVIDIVTDYIRPKKQSFAGAHVTGFLSKEQKSGVKKLNKENQTTDYMLLMAIFMVELYKYSRQEDIVVGTPISGRVHEDTETIAGMFVNTIPMRGYPQGDKKFIDFLKEIKRSALDAYENQEYPFEELVEEVNVRRDMSRNPLFDVMFAIQNNEKVELSIGDITLKALQLSSGVTKFDLDLEIMEDNDGYVLDLAYCSDLFTKDTAQNMLEHYQRLIDSVLADPEEKISELEMLSEKERNCIVKRFNDTWVERSKNWTVISQFEMQVRNVPEKIAIEYDSGALTYRELNGKVNALAEKIRRLGVKENYYIAVMTSLEVETIIGILAVLKSGGSYIPIDCEYPDERINYILSDVSPMLILSTKKKVVADIPVIYMNIADMEEEERNPEPIACDEDLAYVIYTSGTTGKPKGVAVTRKNLNSYLTYANKTYQSGACVTMLITNLCFDLSVTSLYLPFVSGGCLILKEGDTLDKLNAALTDDRITFLKLTPSHLKMLEACTGNVNLPLLQTLIVGGEELTTDIALKTQKLLGQHIKIHNEYGPTEATVGCCDYIYDEKKDIDISVGIGRPIANTQIYIMNGNKLCGIGIPGELCIAGDGVVQGYLNKPELTALKFIKSPEGEGRLYRSGDLARWLPDGQLEYLGRIDKQVKIRGFRVELGEIESALRKQPDISDTAVIALEVAEDKSLCAYLVATDKVTQLNTIQIKEELRKELPEYMIPVYMMQIDTLPLNCSGKLDESSLPKPDMSVVHDYVAPRTEIENVILEVFKKILGISIIGIEDSFFELGGDSIKAIRAVTKLRQRGYKLSVTNLMNLKTAKLIGEEIQKNNITRMYEQGEVNGEIPLLAIQNAFFEKNYLVPSHYNQSLLIRNEELFNIAHLKMAIETVIQHHDALRNVYDGHRQITLPIVQSKLYNWYEYEITNKENVEDEIESKSEKIQESMDLFNGPLVKAALFHTPLGEYLMLSIHHLVIDGVSWRIILEDLLNGYQQAQRTGMIVLPQKTASYKEWANALCQYAQSAQVANEAAYWEKTVLRSNNIETSRHNRTASGICQVQTMALDSNVTHQMLFEAEKTYGININDLLLTSLVIAMNRSEQRKSITVEVEGHGREPIDTTIDIDRTVGWFTSVYYVVLESGSSLEDTLIETKESLHSIPNHGLSYGVLRYLVKRENLSVNADITFNYLGTLDYELDCYEGISMSNMSIGKSISEKNTEGIGLSFNGGVMDGKLQFELTYDTGLYTKEEAESFTQAYKDAVIDIVEMCLSRKDVVKTPTDFGVYDISWKEWKKLNINGEIEKMYKLTPLQQGMLFHKLFDKNATSYITQTVFKIKAKLNMDYIRESLDVLAQKYEVLRTKILEEQLNQPMQIVMKDRKIELREIQVNKEVEIEELKKADIIRGFDLAEDSLLRLTVLRMENEYTLLWTKHHITMDGWCTSLIFRDFIKYYEQISSGIDKLQIISQMEEEKREILPYSDFISWLEKQNKQEALEYWKAMLEDYDSAITVQPLQTIKNQNTVSKVEEFTASVEMTKALEQLAKHLNVTLSTIIETAWGILLQKYNRCSDVVFGKVVSGRNADLPGIVNAVGLFINTIPSRLISKEGEKVYELIKDMQAQSIKSMKYEYSLLTDVQSQSKVGKNLIQTLFVFENYYVDESAYEGLSDFDITLESEREENSYEISLSAYLQHTLHLDVMYNSAKYTVDEIRCVLNRMSMLLEEMIADPEAYVSDLTMLTGAEKEKIVTSFNDTYRNNLNEQSVVGLFEEQVKLNPKKIAVEYGKNAITYEELNRKVNALALQLRQIGIEPDDRIAVMTSQKVETIIGILAVLRSGGAYIPIDSDNPMERVEYILNDAAPKVILTTDDRIITKIPMIVMDIVTLKEESANPESVSTKQNIAYIIYTSGTTGKPKGVEVTRGNLDNYLFYANKNYQDGACITALITSLSFDLSVTSLYLPFISGGCLLLKEGEMLERLTSALLDSRITFLKLTPSHLKLLDCVEYVNLPNLTTLIIGGEELTTDIACRTQKMFGEGVRIHNEYGPTEATVGCCDYVYHEEEDIEETVGIGCPITNTQIYILDEEMLCGIGIPGELCIAGAGVAKGYVNQPKLTACKFVPNPFGKGTMYRTGDLAKWLPNGMIEYLGRIDEQVKIRGFRIEPGEIERVLRKQSYVLDTAVIALEEKGEKSLCAYLISKDPTVQLDMLKIKDEIRRELPEYMIPAYMIQISQLPLNSNGKLDKKALPSPEKSTMRNYVMPRNEIEQTLIEICEELLDVSLIGIEDNFFELGGNSIKAIQLISRLRQKGYELSVADLMRYQTIRLIGENIQDVRAIELNLACADDLDDYQDEKRIEIKEQLDRYGNNIKLSHNLSNCSVLSGQKIFLRNDAEAITDIIKIECNAQSVSLALKEIIKKQGALRTKLNPDLCQLEEYSYSDNWEIPVIKGEFKISLSTYQEIVNEINFLSDGKLLSRFLIFEADEKYCYVLSAVHHLVWDGFSQDMLNTMLKEALLGRDDRFMEYSYVNYCKMVHDQIQQLEVSHEQEMKAKEYFEAANLSSSLVLRRDPKRVTILEIRLNEQQLQKFSEYPNETAIQFLTELMYDDQLEEIVKMPFAVLEHNRNDFTIGMLGLSLNLSYMICDMDTKNSERFVFTSEDPSVDQRVIAEKLLLLSQKYGVEDMINLIPVINYQGILNKYITKDTMLLGEMSLQSVIVDSEDIGVGMHFYINNNILSARISGIEIDKAQIERAMMNQ